MTRAKTIKKAGKTGNDKTGAKKGAKKDVEARTYSINETFKKGDIVYHKVWDDTGEVIETGITDDGVNKMTVSFEKVGLKKLRMG